MANSGGRPKAKKKDSRKAKPAKGTGGAGPCSEDELIRGLNHALRRQILRLLHSSKTPLSPAQIEAKLELPGKRGGALGSVSYHVKRLFRFRVISLVDEQPVRGAMEHFYVSEVADSTWVRGLLKRTQKSDEARLWPKGRGQSDKKAAEKKGR